jgi:hypothetical protein
VVQSPFEFHPDVPGWAGFEADGLKVALRLGEVVQDGMAIPIG